MLCKNTVLKLKRLFRMYEFGQIHDIVKRKVSEHFIDSTVE